MHVDANSIHDYVVPGEALRDFCEHSNRALDRRLSKQSLSAARIKLMVFIQHHGSVRSIDLVQGLGHAPRTITEGIDSLERNGLAIRTPDKLDRRVKNISLTDSGVALLAAVKPTLLEFAEQMFEVLNGEERMLFTDFMYRLNARLKEMDKSVELG
jgi:DNA-binding MarR family transcriptional regulator